MSLRNLPVHRLSVHRLGFRRLGLILVFIPALLHAEGGITFRDVAAGSGAGLAYERTESTNAELYREFTDRGVMTVSEVEDTPNKWRGAPGVAIFDADGDGDQDLYVTNGPGTPNSLFINQGSEHGELAFVDRAQEAGVAATDLDSSGVCYGDIDNDGDEDLFVLSPFGPNRLYENLAAENPGSGEPRFADVTAASGLGDELLIAVGCSFGDVDGDGLLDVAVANNTVDWSTLKGIGPSDPFLFNAPNQLFRNLGGNVFEDVSESSGIRDLVSFDPPDPAFFGQPTPTWAIALVDMDLDGDVDLLHADDQGGIPTREMAPFGVDRGYVFLLENDGTGHFRDVTAERGLDAPGAWMGMSFADFNADGRLDVFATNVGDWSATTLTPVDPVYGAFATYDLGRLTSRWFLGAEGNSFEDPGVGDLVATPFGWGTTAVDYDNDGDTDIVYHGGLMFPPFVNCANPGVILQNDGAANFVYDDLALAHSTNHGRRVVHGVASGDLDDDGFVDLVTVSNANVQEEIPLFPYNAVWGSPFDGRLFYQRLFLPTETPGVWEWSGAPDNANGTLTVELSNAENRHRFIKVELLGTAGLVTGGAANRDGIGAVIEVTPEARGRENARPALRPVVGGASYASQDSRELVFGLGRERRATVEILWPGGVRNRLYRVRHGERLLFPEIPCDFTAEWRNAGEYVGCVRQALDELVDAGLLERRERGRFLSSAVRAFVEERLR